MDTMKADAGPARTPRSETELEQQARIAWEAERVAEADASIAAGYYVTLAEMEAWMDSVGTDHPAPAPYPTRPRPL